MNHSRFFRGKSVLITGASSGIGRTLALQLGAAGAQLTLTARRAELLTALADEVVGLGAVRPVISTCDVTRDGDLERAVADAVSAFAGLDVVFANAGFGVAGYCATPGNSPYCMSKFALRALANSITPELAQAGVRVTLISPGFVASNIRKVDNSGHFNPETPDTIPGWLVVDTERACHQILRAVAAGRREAIITGHGKLLVVIERFAPWLLRAAGRRMAARGRGHRPGADAR